MSDVGYHFTNLWFAGEAEGERLESGWEIS